MSAVTIDFANIVNAFPLSAIVAGVASVALVSSFVPLARKAYESIFSFIASRK